MIEVSAAIIKKDGKILIAQRNRNQSLALKWEFPGGKVEPNESIKQGLKREIREELNIDIEVKEKLGEILFEHSNNILKLTAFYAEWVSGDLEALEHERLEWVTVEELENFDFAPADMYFVKKLKEEGKTNSHN